MRGDSSKGRKLTGLSAVNTAVTNQTSPSIDIAGHPETVVVIAGNLAGGTATITIQDSLDDSTFGNIAAVGAISLSGISGVFQRNVRLPAEKVRRYVRARVTTTGSPILTIAAVQLGNRMTQAQTPDYEA
jgi:hypothetical protein